VAEIIINNKKNINMKLSIKYMTLLLLFSIIGCTKEEETANISRITYYPTIELKGEQWNEIPVGGTFTDPGVIATEGASPLTPKVSGTVDGSTPGVYTITYVATNKDGYEAEEYRYVGVIAPSVKGMDVSGNYKRNAGAGGVSAVSKVKGNLFFANNVGGIAVPNPSVGVNFYYYADGKLGVPYQRTPGNAFACKDATIKPGISYAWVVLNSGYGTALRTFVKQ
jgi:Domain of unknown function (DUF5011)